MTAVLFDTCQTDMSALDYDTKRGQNFGARCILPEWYFQRKIGGSGLKDRRQWNRHYWQFCQTDSSQIGAADHRDSTNPANPVFARRRKKAWGRRYTDNPKRSVK